MAVILTVPVYLCIILLHLYGLDANNIASQKEKDYQDAIYLKPNEHYKKNDEVEFVTFCFDGVPKSFLQIWRSVQCVLEHAPLSYEIFTGENASDVKNKYYSKSMWSPSSWLTGQKTNIDFPAFSPHCVGIASKESYVLFLKVRVINYWRVLQTIIGVILFLSAPSLSRNSFFHYTSGVSVGVLASLLILVFFLSKFIPQKSASYAIIVFGYSIVLYVLQVIWHHLNDIISNYMDIVLIYCFCSAFISFLVCYRLGPVRNVRTFNIIQWCMQVIAIILIYLGSEYREVSTAVIIILITARLIPSSWISYSHRLWYRFFPPKIRLLTELEYIEQGSRETAKALEELRKFCRSPDCNTWKVVRQLKDPIRFSNFIETGSHYTDDELLRYNSEGFDEDDIENETEYSNSTSNGYATPVRSYWNHK